MSLDESLSEWSDLFIDEISIVSQVGRDDWGNAVTVATSPVMGRVTSRNVRGGGSMGEVQTEQPDQWTITAVVPYIEPVPDVGTLMYINSVEYEIGSIVIHNDITNETGDTGPQGHVLEITATATEAQDA